MSAYELEQRQLREVNKGDYLKKPLHIAKLIESVKTVLSEPMEEEEKEQKEASSK